MLINSRINVLLGRASEVRREMLRRLNNRSAVASTAEAQRFEFTHYQHAPASGSGTFAHQRRVTAPRFLSVSYQGTHMAKQDTFTTEEWNLLRLAPSLISGGTAAADPSGIFGSIKEATAGASGMADAFKAHGALELFTALAADRSIPGMPDAKSLLGEGSREQQLQNFRDAVLQRVRTAVDLVASKASPAEADAYRQMLAAVAQKAADASKGGGFLGFGGVRVSEKEQAFITEVKRAVGIA